MAKDISPVINLAHYPVAPDIEMTLRIMLGRGIFERKSFEKFMSHVQGRDTAVEIGAHVGSWALGFAKLFKHVVAFEPQPTNRDYLEKNIARAKAQNICVSSYAVSNNLCQQFAISASGTTRNSGMAHLVPADQNTQNAIPVKTITLDDFWLAADPNQLRRIDGLKIDVEGMELNVLKGGVGTIQDHRPMILLEINRHCKRYDITKEELLDYMSDIRYAQIDRSRNDYTFGPI